MRIYPLLLLALLFACQGNETADLESVEVTDEYGNLERYQRRVSDYAREGWSLRISPEGEVIEAAHYVHDTLDGNRFLFFESGDTSVVETYRGGQFDGPYRVYREDGSLMLEGQFAANVREGEWRGYYPNGQLKEVVQFQDNAENGPFTEYHPNGKLKAEGYYREGDNEDGQLKLYNENGELTRRMDCRMGRCSTVWSADEVTATQ